jgi:hypothetical protein
MQAMTPHLRCKNPAAQSLTSQLISAKAESINENQQPWLEGAPSHAKQVRVAPGWEDRSK